MQNLVVLIETSYSPWDISWKAGNTCLNRFCIDEDAAFELSGIYYFQKAVYNIPIEDQNFGPKDKGTESYVWNIQMS